MSSIKLPKLPDGAIVRGKDINKIIDVLANALQIHCGPGLEARFNSSGQYISIIKHPADVLRGAQSEEGSGEDTTSSRTSFFAKIVNYAVEGTNQWRYTCEQVVKRTTAYTGWHGTNVHFEAFNTCEHINDGAGVEGNGVDVDNPSFEGFSIQPAPVGSIVRVWAVLPSGSPQTTEYWFSYENGIDGECPE